MTVHELLKWSSGLLGLAMYVPLVIDVIKRGGRGHSFAMWALWAMLDTTAAVSLMVQDGNYLLTLAFSIGSVLMSAMLLRYGHFKWGKLEWLVLILVLLCLAVWATTGPRGATVAATLAIIAAGTPGVVELWRHPDYTAARVWGGFCIANLLALMGGESWSLEERFPPAAFTLQTIAMFIVGNRNTLNRMCTRHSSVAPSNTSKSPCTPESQD